MIHLIGIGKNVDLSVRGTFSICSTALEEKLLAISEFSQEVVIISTCNRTEIYLNSSLSETDLVNKTFTALNWPMEHKEFTFYCAEHEAISHLLEVSCGFHSKILGEDQILGQIKNAYETSNSLELVISDLRKLFMLAISCGKEFKTTTMLYKLPVSYSSIAVKKALSLKKKSFLVVGFGNMARLALNYLISKINTIDTIYIAVRDVAKVLKSDFIKGNAHHIMEKKLNIISIASMGNCYTLVDTLICCTSSPTPIILEKDLSNRELLIFDLSLPINVESTARDIEKVTLYNIDDLHTVDEENKAARKSIMEHHRSIIEKYKQKYDEYEKLKNIHSKIINLKSRGFEISQNRYITYSNKKYTKDNDDLVKTLLKSTSNSYINKAIEVLKEETIKGNGEITLSIIEKIFGSCR